MTTQAMNGRAWFPVLYAFIGFILGGGASAAVGNYQYTRLRSEMQLVTAESKYERNTLRIESQAQSKEMQGAFNAEQIETRKELGSLRERVSSIEEKISNVEKMVEYLYEIERKK